MSGTEFDRKAMVVVTAQNILEKEDGWENVFSRYDLGFPYAFLVVEGHGTLNERGRKAVEETYDFLRNALNLPEDNYLGYGDMLAKWDGN